MFANKRKLGIFFIILGVVFLVIFIAVSNHNTDNEPISDTSKEDVLANVEDYFPDKLSEDNPESQESNGLGDDINENTEDEEIRESEDQAETGGSYVETDDNGLENATSPNDPASEPESSPQESGYTGILQLEGFDDEILLLIDNQADKLTEALQAYANSIGYPGTQTAVFVGTAILDYINDTVTLDIYYDNENFTKIEAIYYKDRQEFQIMPY